MAKWGEGDPRWIVEERPDATNVNNWHWTEKNATAWSKDKLKSLLDGFEIRQSGVCVRIKTCEKLEGEAFANNRKGKLIFFYEWNIVLKWEGKLEGEDAYTTDGKVTIPNLSEENDVDEVELTVTIDESNERNERLKAFMYNVGRDKIREKLQTYVTNLKQDFAKDLILPSKDDTKSVVKNHSSGFNKKIDMQPIQSKPTVGLRLEVETVKLTENFQCRAHELYDVFTKREMLEAFTRNTVKIEASKGGEFQMFGGNISGKFEELVPHSKITQQWRYKPWPAGHFSHVTLEFDEKDDHTELRLTQKEVPTAEVNSTKQNWSRYYFECIKRTFGFGAFLY